MDKRKPGRPEGTIDSPRVMLQRDIKDSVKLNQRLRGLLNKQIDAVERLLENDDIPLPDRLKVIEALTNSLGAQSKGIESTAKHIVNVESEGGKGEEEVTLESLIGGKR